MLKIKKIAVYTTTAFIAIALLVILITGLLPYPTPSTAYRPA